jgi:hypothetical protein
VLVLTTLIFFNSCSIGFLFFALASCGSVEGNEAVLTMSIKVSRNRSQKEKHTYHAQAVNHVQSVNHGLNVIHASTVESHSDLAWKICGRNGTSQ